MILDLQKSLFTKEMDQKISKQTVTERLDTVSNLNQLRYKKYFKLRAVA